MERRPPEPVPQSIEEKSSPEDRQKFLALLRSLQDKTFSRRSFIKLVFPLMGYLAVNHVTKGHFASWIKSLLTDEVFRAKFIKSLEQGKIFEDIAQVTSSRESIKIGDIEMEPVEFHEAWMDIFKSVEIHRIKKMPVEQVARPFEVGERHFYNESPEGMMVIAMGPKRIKIRKAIKFPLERIVPPDETGLSIDPTPPGGATLPSAPFADSGVPQAYTAFLDENRKIREFFDQDGEHIGGRSPNRGALVVLPDGTFFLASPTEAMQYTVGENANTIVTYPYMYDSADKTPLNPDDFKTKTDRNMLTERTQSSCLVTFYDAAGKSTTQILSQYQYLDMKKNEYDADGSDNCVEFSRLSFAEWIKLVEFFAAKNKSVRYVVAVGDPDYSAVNISAEPHWFNDIVEYAEDGKGMGHAKQQTNMISNYWGKQPEISEEFFVFRSLRSGSGIGLSTDSDLGSWPQRYLEAQ